jgi:hypothetical protein
MAFWDLTESGGGGGPSGNATLQDAYDDGAGTTAGIIEITHAEGGIYVVDITPTQNDILLACQPNGGAGQLFSVAANGVIVGSGVLPGVPLTVYGDAAFGTPTPAGSWGNLTGPHGGHQRLYTACRSVCR